MSQGAFLQGTKAEWVELLFVNIPASVHLYFSSLFTSVDQPCPLLSGAVIPPRLFNQHGGGVGVGQASIVLSAASVSVYENSPDSHNGCQPGRGLWQSAGPFLFFIREIMSS